MTNWDKIKEATKGLFNDISKKEFAENLANTSDMCQYCNLEERCNRLFYLHDENGIVVKDDDGDNVLNENFPGCESIILGYLEEDTE